MRTNRKRFLAVIILTAFILINLFSASINVEAIISASHQELLMMAELRKLDVQDKSDDEIKQLLLNYEGLELKEEEKQEEKANEYNMEILSANSMSILSNNNILLEGDVKVSFSFSEQDSPKILSANKMIVDPNVKSVTAYSNVKFEDKDSKSGLSEITADVVTYSYSAGDLIVTGGSTESERKNNEDEKIVFSTSADILNYRNKDSGLFFTDGSITTDKEKSLSTISAKEIAILDGGDMFLSNAYLKIGRVPILYLPFFFYPGSRLALNPAFGFNSARGLFASATIELFGTYPSFTEDSEESSFASLLKSEDSKDLVSNGLYYDKSDKEESSFDKWVKKNGNYFTLLFDAYEKFGLHLGYDLLIKSDKFKILSKSGLAYSNPNNNIYNKELRYYSNSEISLNFKDLKLNAKIPFYSDPEVNKKYSSRLTSFSIDSFLGAAQKFPEESSTITSYEMVLNSSLSLPSKLKPSFIDSATISKLELKGKYNYSISEQKYLIEDIYLPNITANISGTIFSFSESVKENKEEKDKEIAFSDYFILSDPLLSNMYESKSSSKTNSKQSSLSLKYSINEELNNSFDRDEKQKKLINEILKNNISGKITLQGNIKNTFSFTQIITPEYTHTFDEAKKETKDNLTFRSDTTLSLPFIGITYNLNSYLYKQEAIKLDEKYSEKQTYWAFDKDNIKAHSISFSKSYNLSIGQINPSLKYTLKPLTQAITAGLSYKLYDFTLSFSWYFKQQDEIIKSDDIKLSIGYLSKYFTYSLSLTYKSSIYDKADFFKPLSFNSSISLRTEDKKYSLTEYIKYVYENNGIYNSIDELTTTLVSPYLTLSYSGSYIDKKYSHTSFDLSSKIKTNTMYSWHNRILTQFAVDSKFHYAFENHYATNLSLTFSLNFKIQEFLAINLSVKTTNNSFYKYYDDKDNLNFSLIWQDLKNSFDFLSNGRYNTGFTMDSLSIELVHYMTDWNLYCKYSASIVSSQAGYEWIPTVSIFLKWKTIPDLKIDENYKQSSLGEWEATSTVYGKK